MFSCLASVNEVPVKLRYQLCIAIWEDQTPLTRSCNPQELPPIHAKHT